MILDSILTKTRELCGCDAGTIYLAEEGKLNFAYAQNETLFPGDASLRFLYLSASLPIDEQSIAGYVAFHRAVVNIPDVYELPPDAQADVEHYQALNAYADKRLDKCVFGEEKPAVQGSGEEAWRLNRRDEFSLYHNQK